MQSPIRRLETCLSCTVAHILRGPGEHAVSINNSKPAKSTESQAPLSSDSVVPRGCCLAARREL